jgi:hypothetical protein
MDDGRFRLWVGASLAAHLLVLALILLDFDRRKIEEPREQAMEVEFIAPSETAQGETPAPRAPVNVPAPPSPEPPEVEPARPAPPAPPPPPPPPPPAPAAAAAPPTPQPPRPTAAAPPPEPAPSPVPVPPRPQQQAQAPTPPTPAAPTPAPPRPTPPLPLPPPPVPPPPEPSQAPGTGQTPPVQRPQERSQSVLNTLERLRQQQQPQQQPPTARANPRPASAPDRTGGTPNGVANLTAAERAGLADKIGECWAVDAGAPNISTIVVELRVQVDAGGVVRQVLPNGAVPTDPRARMVFEAARRALLDPRCNPLPLSRDRLEALRNTIFRFNPRELGLR